jgi:hypothetical protein
VKITIFSVLLAALALPAGAATLRVEADDSSGFSYFADPFAAVNNPAIAGNPALSLAVASGNDLRLGTHVLVGSFLGLSDTQIQSRATDIAFLRQSFTLFGSARIGDGGDPEGYLTGSATGSTASLAGQQIYMFVVAGTDNTTVDRSFETAFQLGIYYVDRAVKPAWAFPSDSPIPGITTIDIADLTIQNNGTALETAGARVVVGSFGPDRSDTLSDKTNFTLAPVPEPGSATLLLLATATALGSHRRRARR